MEQHLELDNQQERREAAIRLAAFFEGEGSFIVSTYQKGNWLICTPVIRLGNCDPDAIYEMGRILKLFNVGYRIYLQTKYKENHAQCAVLGIEGCKRVQAFLETFGDFFFGRKRNNVRLFKKYIPIILGLHRDRQQKDYRIQMVNEFRAANAELNRLGVSRFLIDYTPNALEAKI